MYFQSILQIIHVPAGGSFLRNLVFCLSEPQIIVITTIIIITHIVTRSLVLKIVVIKVCCLFKVGLKSIMSSISNIVWQSHLFSHFLKIVLLL